MKSILKIFIAGVLLSAGLSAQKVDLKPQDVADLLHIQATHYKILAEYITLRAEVALIKPGSENATVTSKNLEMELLGNRLGELKLKYDGKIIEFRKSYNCLNCSLTDNLELLRPPAPGKTPDPIK